MKALILEDDKTRQRAIRLIRNHGFSIVRIVETAEDAIDALIEADDWDLVCLDHDLGGEEMVDSPGQGAGYEVACWLEANRPGQAVVIHSLNPVGRDKMAAALPGAVIYPEAWKLPETLKLVARRAAEMRGKAKGGG